MSFIPPLGHKFSTGQVKRSGIPTINKSSSLNQGLLFYAFDTGLGLVIDLVSGGFGTRTGSPTFFTCPYGSALFNPTALSFPSTAAIRTATAAPPYSWASAYFQTVGAAQFTNIFGRLANGGGSQPFWNWNFSINSSNSAPWNEYSQLNNNGGISTGLFSGDSSGNSFKSLVGVANTGSFSFYKNGSLVGSTGVTPKNNSVTDTIQLGGGNLAAFYGAFWNRALTASEIVRLHYDPYGFLIFPQDTISQQCRLSQISASIAAAQSSSYGSVSATEVLVSSLVAFQAGNYAAINASEVLSASFALNQQSDFGSLSGSEAIAATLAASEGSGFGRLSAAEIVAAALAASEGSGFANLNADEVIAAVARATQGDSYAFVTSLGVISATIAAVQNAGFAGLLGDELIFGLITAAQLADFASLVNFPDRRGLCGLTDSRTNAAVLSDITVSAASLSNQAVAVATLSDSA